MHAATHSQNVQLRPRLPAPASLSLPLADLALAPWTPEAGDAAGASVLGGGGRSGRGAVLVVHTLGMAAAPVVACTSGRGAVLVVHTPGMAAAPGVACPAGAESLSAVLNMPATSTGSVTGSP